MTKQNRPRQLEKLFDKIQNCIDNKKVRITTHALHRQNEREISLPDALYVLKYGYHEKARQRSMKFSKPGSMRFEGKQLIKKMYE